MRTIPLACGKTVTVSDCDFKRVSLLSWSDRGNGYARARFRKGAGGDGSVVYLHRFILGAPHGVIVDHIDGNPLNNTRENLQFSTQSRNIMRAKNGGVTKARNKWRARLRVDGKMRSLGCYPSKEEAAAVIEIEKAKVWADFDINVYGVEA